MTKHGKITLISITNFNFVNPQSKAAGTFGLRLKAESSKLWGGVQKKRAGRILEGRTWDEMPIRMGLVKV